MSSLAGPLMDGNFWRRRATISCVSYRLSVVCVKNDNFSGSSTSRASTAATESTTIVRSGASPEVPMISWWSRCPINMIVRFSRKLKRFQVHLGYQRASRIDHPQRAILSFLPHRRGNPMSVEHQHATVRNVTNGLDENRPAPAQLLHYVCVVHDFMVHVNRRAIGLQGEFDDVHRAHNSGAETARAYSQQNLFSVCLHHHPK